MDPIRILVADDHALIRTGMKNLLEGNKEFLVVGEAADGEEVIQKARELKPDVVVMDISMPKVNGIEATRILKQSRPETGILVLTMHENAEYANQVFKAGASGYVLKNAGKEEISTAIYAVARGEKYFSSRVSEIVMSEYARQSEIRSSEAALTKREQEILDLIGKGLNNQQIADQLFISPRTVETHRTNIMQKLNIHDAPNLVRYALEHGYGKKS